MKKKKETPRPTVLAASRVRRAAMRIVPCFSFSKRVFAVWAAGRCLSHQKRRVLFTSTQDATDFLDRGRFAGYQFA